MSADFIAVKLNQLGLSGGPARPAGRAGDVRGRSGWTTPLSMARRSSARASSAPLTLKAAMADHAGVMQRIYASAG